MSKNTEENTFTEIYHSIMGDLYVGASSKGLKFIKLLGETDNKPDIHPNVYTKAAVKQLDMYFNAKLQNFNLDFDLEGHTGFSIEVWQKLVKIPYGTTISYKQLAIQMGDLKCIRAAASANGRNPIPIIIPCHRVIGSDGSLTGFALGLEFKRKLLELENPSKYSKRQGTLEL